MPRSFDFNNSFSDAPLIGILGTDLDISGNLGGVQFVDSFPYIDRVDYFAFEVNGDRNVVISSDEDDVTVWLYDDRRRLIDTLSDDTYGGDYAKAHDFAEGLALPLSDGFYYLRVSGANGFTDYNIDFDAAIDTDYHLDAADELGSIDCSRRIQGEVGELDLADSYQFQPGRPGQFIITQTSTGREGEMQLYDEEGDLIEAGVGRIQASLEDDRDYYVQVFAADVKDDRSYKLTLIPNPVYQGTEKADRLKGCDDDETFRGLEGDDVLLGQKGSDKLIGAAGDDRLEGGNGDDRLDGGRNHDVLFGGRGRDIFVLLGNNNGDRIRDFQNGLDQLDLPDRIPFNSVDIISQGRNTSIQAGRHELALLVNVAANQITAVDFI